MTDDRTIAAMAADTGQSMPSADAIAAAQEAIAERMEQELRGAWRAGYDYLHVYGPTLGAFDPDEPVRIEQAVLPANSERVPRLADGWVYQYTYDLTAVPDGLLRMAAGGASQKQYEECTLRGEVRE